MEQNHKLTKITNLSTKNSHKMSSLYSQLTSLETDARADNLNDVLNYFQNLKRLEYLKADYIGKFGIHQMPFANLRRLDLGYK